MTARSWRSEMLDGSGWTVHTAAQSWHRLVAAATWSKRFQTPSPPCLKPHGRLLLREATRGRADRSSNQSVHGYEHNLSLTVQDLDRTATTPCEKAGLPWPVTPARPLMSCWNVTVRGIGRDETVGLEVVMRRSNRMKRILREQWKPILPLTLQRGR
jgi:hypothetical protein